MRSVIAVMGDHRGITGRKGVPVSQTPSAHLPDFVQVSTAGECPPLAAPQVCLQESGEDCVNLLVAASSATAHPETSRALLPGDHTQLPCPLLHHLPGPAPALTSPWPSRGGAWALLE